MKKGLWIAIVALLLLLALAGGLLLYIQSIREDPMQAFQTPAPAASPAPTLAASAAPSPSPSPTLSPEEELAQAADRDFMQNRVNILLLGWDQSPEREEEGSDLYRDEENNFRSDVMMLLTVDFAGGQVDLISIPGIPWPAFTIPPAAGRSTPPLPREAAPPARVSNMP